MASDKEGRGLRKGWRNMVSKRTEEGDKVKGAVMKA